MGKAIGIRGLEGPEIKNEVYGRGGPSGAILSISDQMQEII